MTSRRCIMLSLLTALSAACSTRGPHESAQDFYGTDDSRRPADAQSYTLKGDCDGFPRIVDVKTAPGLCLGLVDANRNPSIPLRMPRAIVAYGDDLVLVDMAGWQQLKGQVFLLKKRPDGLYRRFLLLDFAEFPKEQRRHFYMTSTVQLGPDGKIWVGAAGSIFRFDPRADLFDGNAASVYSDPKQVELRRIVRGGFEVVLDKLPYKSFVNSKVDSLHPLKPFVFSNDGKFLYLGIGASTDNCGTGLKKKEKCTEVEVFVQGKIASHASMYRYELDTDFRPRSDPQLVARGLRNSLAIAIHPESGELYQGENARDIRGAVHSSRLGPPDELNIVAEGQHYGWPYCSGFTEVQREYVGAAWDCGKYAAPHILLPPHAAPLQMIFYTGTKLPSWYANRLLVPFHGREEFGHRLVTFEVGDDGRPTGLPLDMVYGWGTPGGSLTPLGSPMGIAQASDGSIVMVEDKGKRIVRLSTVPAEGPAIPGSSPKDDEWLRHNLAR